MFDGEGVKADVDFGPTLMLNRNRCILCTRCVRFMREVDGDAQIGIVDRGYGSEIATFEEAGRPLAAVRQSDGRLPGRRDHDARLPLQVAGRGTTRTPSTRSARSARRAATRRAWLKAKPEWAKGAQLMRMTPRFNPDVNGYWMCDIGRFDYHWVESDDAAAQPMLRAGAARSQPRGWHDALAAAARSRARVGAADPASCASSCPAHASLEELFVLEQLGGLRAPTGGVALSWRAREKPQPADAKFKIPAD